MAKVKNQHQYNLPAGFIKCLSEGGFILIVTCALFVALALFTYSPKDPIWSHIYHSAYKIHNAGGQVGANVAEILYLLLGYMAYLLPIGVAYVAWFIVQEQRSLRRINQYVLFLRTSGLFFFMIGGCGLLDLIINNKKMYLKFNSGGLLGNFIAEGFNYALNRQGALLLLIAILLVGVTWFTGLSWLNFLENIGYLTIISSQKIILFLQKFGKLILHYIQLLKLPNTTNVTSTTSLSNFKNSSNNVKNINNKIPKIGSEIALKLPVTPILNEIKIEPIVDISNYQELIINNNDQINSKLINVLPDLSLLEKGEIGKALGGYTHQELEILSREVEQHLLDFGLQVDVVAVHPGPVITRFELQLSAGLKVSKLSALAKDLARALSVMSVRIVEVIPGKTVVGLELPNQYRQIVRLYEILISENYQTAMSPLTLALGVDISGQPMIVDLAKMPHLLVAGTTGSGKSVGINAMILSLLFKSTPKQVRLIMVDPKMLELSIYDGIPHLLTPVVTDMKEAASALRWCVEEMEKRYRLMASLGVRNLAGYNLKINEANAKNEPILDPLWKNTDDIDQIQPLLETLPYIVVIIDELADMMMVVGKKVEQLIARIAQKARAAGIHLILATQRPSVDVLTGLIKSNIPTRISFQVSSKIDSRTILDQQGAESLLGHGDMLYLAPGTGAPLRAHGAFIDDKEVHRIADDWRSRGKPEYVDEITQNYIEDSNDTENGQHTEDVDPLYDQVVEFVVQTRKASISSVQRRFKIGYNRAARLVEEMERVGIVGALEGGSRDVLVNTFDDA